jgi:osmotically-inducible protein OsmY
MLADRCGQAYADRAHSTVRKRTQSVLYRVGHPCTDAHKPDTAGIHAGPAGTDACVAAQTGSSETFRLESPSSIGEKAMKTDSQLQQDVIAELKWEPSVTAPGIGVEVRDGIVTLAGEVSSYAEKLNAESATQRVCGVKALATELKVKLAGSGKRNDADIAKSVENVLEWTTWVPDNAIKVLVENGWVTLSGNVDWQYQKQSATDSVRFLSGVTGVSDQIAIKPKLSVSAVKSDIEAALKRSAVADAKKISVNINGSNVTLTGTVHSWNEREIATMSAWGTPGVRSVIDKMTLEY